MNEATAGSREPRVEVRFGPVGLAQVRIRTTDPAVVEADLAGRVATAPKMFDRMPVALDLNELERAPDRAALRAVLDAIRRAGFIPIGFARGTEAVDALARDLEMPVLMQFRAAKRGAAESRADEPEADLLAGLPSAPTPAVATTAAPTPLPKAAVPPPTPTPTPTRAPAPARARPAAPVPTAGIPMTPAAAAAARRAGLNRPPALRDSDGSTAAPEAAAEHEVEPAAATTSAVPPAASPAPASPRTAPRAESSPDGGPSSLLHAQTVRSGQRLYARNRDLVVTATVGAGAEVMADGCVHVYGSLRGRAMAGTRGDTAARVFCQEFHAELVSIAGVFRVFETIPPELEGQPVQAWLDGEDLRFARIG